MFVGTVALAAALIWLTVVHYLEREHTDKVHRAEVERLTSVQQDLLNRLASRTLGEYVGATLATDDHPGPPLPDGWNRDDTGLIEEPYWRDDRVVE